MEAFVAAYAKSRFGDAWQLPEDQSLLFHSGETTLSRQIQIHAPKASNDVVQLPHGCSLFLYRVKSESLTANAVLNSNGLRLLPLEECLFRVPASFYELKPQAAQIALIPATAHSLPHEEGRMGRLLSDSMRHFIDQPHLGTAHELDDIQQNQHAVVQRTKGQQVLVSDR